MGFNLSKIIISILFIIGLFWPLIFENHELTLLSKTYLARRTMHSEIFKFYFSGSNTFGDKSNFCITCATSCIIFKHVKYLCTIFAQCGSYRGLAFLQCKNLNFPYYYRVLQCKTLKVEDEDWRRVKIWQRATTSRSRRESIMQEMMLSGPPRLLEQRDKKRMTTAYKSH